MKIKLVIILFTLLLGCSQNIENLTKSKNKVKQYYESGQYNAELNLIVDKIKTDFEDYSFSHNDAVIFDVDETALSNYEYIKSINFGYEYNLWNNYMLEGSAKVIGPVNDLYMWFKSRNARIIFLTGRKSQTYESTYHNLINEGYNGFDTLICRSKESDNLPADKYKEEARRKLSDQGYNIIACIGDLNSDLTGDFTGKKYKLPNYIYDF